MDENDFLKKDEVLVATDLEEIKTFEEKPKKESKTKLKIAIYGFTVIGLILIISFILNHYSETPNSETQKCVDELFTKSLDSNHLGCFDASCKSVNETAEWASSFNILNKTIRCSINGTYTDTGAVNSEECTMFNVDYDNFKLCVEDVIERFDLEGKI